MTSMYHVSWEIEIEADSIEEAAVTALAIQRDRNSFATVFSITPRCEDADCNAFHYDRDRKNVDVMRLEKINVH